MTKRKRREQQKRWKAFFAQKYNEALLLGAIPDTARTAAWWALLEGGVPKTGRDFVWNWIEHMYPWQQRAHYRRTGTASVDWQQWEEVLFR